MEKTVKTTIRACHNEEDYRRWHFIATCQFTRNRFLFVIALIFMTAGCGKVESPVLPTETRTALIASATAITTSTPLPTIAETPTASAQRTSPPGRSGPYLGETLPGAESRSFGAGLLRGGYHSSPSFIPDGSEIFWGGEYASAKIYSMKSIDGNWTRQETLQLPGMVTLRDPFISPDGMQLFFLSIDPLPGAATSGKENIWMVVKDGDQWGTPQPLPEVVNQMDLHWTVSVAMNGNLYFSSGKDGIGDIYVSMYVNGEYTQPVLLDSPVNTPDQIEVTPNIAPDESYILFSRMPDSNSTPRLYISYSTQIGWTEPKLVENVRSCISPIVTPDRKYVFCLSGPSALIWRDTAFIDAFRP
jgi:hypothetical protein